MPTSYGGCLLCCGTCVALRTLIRFRQQSKPGIGRSTGFDKASEKFDGRQSCGLQFKVSLIEASEAVLLKMPVARPQEQIPDLSGEDTFQAMKALARRTQKLEATMIKCWQELSNSGLESQNGRPRLLRMFSRSSMIMARS